MTDIHPTAIVSKKAKLGENVVVSPFATINDDVEIGDDSFIGPHVVIYNGARIGKQVRIFQGASISHIPQITGFKDTASLCIIGDGSTIHEFVTIHKASKEGTQTYIGKNVLMMAYSHLAHDCYIGDNAIIANAVQIGGYVSIGEWAIIGGATPVHQFCKIGRHCMIGGGFTVSKDVPPYILAAGDPLRFAGLNFTGLKRRGFSPEQLDKLKKIFFVLYESKLNISQAKEKIIEQFAGEPFADEVIEFINQSKRGLIGSSARQEYE
ncbi:MAG: acyl-ACP--UDP-N-acetylglucosamine O-acyltransferase [Ignavibacteria bacterium]|nr:acyl-ACP--UDP-N-acetylglucosamine O-acyltransferase [Ignavibacteria bacterium]